MEPSKVRISIMVDEDVIAEFKAKAMSIGGAYQTLMNKALRQAIETDESRGLEERVRRLEKAVFKKR